MGDKPAATITVPAVYEPTEYERRPRWWQCCLAEAADRVGWDVAPEQLLVHASEPITATQQAAVEGAVANATGLLLSFQVEAGAYAGTDPIIAWMALGLTLVFAGGCTAVAVGLARQDARRDDFTLGSLGASPALAKTVSAWQGGVIVGLASTLGLALSITWVAIDSRSHLGFAFAPNSAVHRDRMGRVATAHRRDCVGSHQAAANPSLPPRELKTLLTPHGT